VTNPCLSDTLDAPLAAVRRTATTSRNHCRLDLRVVPAPAPPTPKAEPKKRSIGRRTWIRLGVSIVALELLVAGGLRVGVGAPESKTVAPADAAISAPVTARSLSTFEAPTARPSVAAVIRERAEQIASAELAPAHLAERPSGFGTF